jgi:predicted dehydrogenase
MKRMDRRNFLVTTGAFGALASASVQARAEDAIRVGFLGTQHGHFSGKLAALQASPDYEVVAVCEPDPTALAEMKSDSRYAELPWVSEDALLGDASIPLVVVECKFWEAIDLGRKVIDAGKHLHLEKPPGSALEPFQELVQEARRKELLLQMGYVFRTHDGLNAAFEAARKGWLGDVYLLRGTLDKDLQVERRKNWGRYKGGTFFELASHYVDLVVDLWGRPTKITSWMRNDTLKDGLADNTLAVFEYPHGMAILTSAATMAGSGGHRSFEVIGTDGSFVIRPIEPGTGMQVVMREARGPYREGWQDVELPKQQRYVEDFEQLAKALKTGEPLKYSYDHELLVQETLIRACEA